MEIVQLKAEMMHVAQVIMRPFIHSLRWERFDENQLEGVERAEIKGIRIKDVREMIT